MTKDSIPNVFIIESLTLDDEYNNRFEGKFLSHILNLDRDNQESKYYYIRTKRELETIIEKFYESRFRYLHISCHGNDKNVYTTLDEISYKNFGKILRPNLKDRRLFLSACEAVNRGMAQEILEKSSCYSLIGFGKKIAFSDAAVNWASFYHLMFKKNPDSMKRHSIIPILRNIKKIYGIDMRYFSKIDKNSKSIREDLI